MWFCRIFAWSEKYGPTDDWVYMLTCFVFAFRSDIFSVYLTVPCKNRLPYNLYCVGGHVKHCSIQRLFPGWSCAARGTATAAPPPVCCMGSVRVCCQNYRLFRTQQRVVTGTRKFDHITPVLHQLHWLPVRQRITCYNILDILYCRWILKVSTNIKKLKKKQQEACRKRGELKKQKS